MKQVILHIALLLAPALLWGQMDSLVTIENGSRSIEGNLMMPDVDKAVPVVLIIPGSGPTDRNGNNGLMTNNSLKMLASGLRDNGIASLRYDKRGLKGNPMGEQQEADLRFEDFVADTRLWFNYLNTLDGISEIHVLGHSQGSLVGILAAQGSEIRSVISLAGSGEPIDNIIREQLKSQPAVIQEQSAIILDSLEEGHDVKNIHPMLQSLFRPSVQPFIRSWIQYDPVAELAKLKRPVLILNGTTDIQVGVDQAKKLHAAEPKSEMVIIENMNHVLKEAAADRNKNLSTYYDPNLSLAPQLVPAIVNFIKSQ